MVMIKRLKLLTFYWNYNLRHARQNFVRTFFDKVVDAFLHDKVVRIVSFGQTIEEHGQVVMEIQFFYWHLGKSVLFFVY